jgi:hypothetical protein
MFDRARFITDRAGAGLLILELTGILEKETMR